LVQRHFRNLFAFSETKNLIKKIISGGQTGADRAALDFALEFDIPTVAGFRKGERQRAGPIPEKYQLQEMPTDSYAARTEQNVINSDGTLIFSRGQPTGGTAYTLKVARIHKKPLLHVDVNLPTSYDAASLILSWIRKFKIEVLNVAGPRASKVAKIYGEVFRILKMAYKMSEAGQNRPAERQPKTVDEAVKILIEKLSVRDSTIIANMEEDDLVTLQINLGVYIGGEFDIWSGNQELIKSCSFIAGDPYLHEDFAPMIIIEELWNRLQDNHKLRIVK
jgi:hypothetical protein